MSIEDKLFKKCNGVEARASKEAKTMMECWEIPEEKENMEYRLKQLWRVSFTREEFLNHPWLWLLCEIKWKFGYWKFIIKVRLRKLFKIIGFK